MENVFGSIAFEYSKEFEDVLKDKIKAKAKDRDEDRQENDDPSGAEDFSTTRPIDFLHLTLSGDHEINHLRFYADEVVTKDAEQDGDQKGTGRLDKHGLNGADANTAEEIP